jgi:hypothetical protein
LAQVRVGVQDYEASGAQGYRASGVQPGVNTRYAIPDYNDGDTYAEKPFDDAVAYLHNDYAMECAAEVQNLQRGPSE